MLRSEEALVCSMKHFPSHAHRDVIVSALVQHPRPAGGPLGHRCGTLSSAWKWDDVTESPMDLLWSLSQSVFQNPSGHTYRSLFASVRVVGLCLGLSEVVLQFLSALQIGARLHRPRASVCVEAVGRPCRGATMYFAYTLIWGFKIKVPFLQHIPV